jgi:branched-chain amino acid transport system permease protein
VVSALFAAVVAYPILRLRGIYFAIAMLGVGQVLSELFGNSPLIEGAMGVVVPPVTPGDMAPERFFYYLFLAAVVITLALSALIRRSKFGYGLASIREDEDTARMLGVPTETYKIAVFVISAFLVGVFGVLYGYSLGYFTTGSVFRIDFSLNMILHPLIGGIGTLFGPVIGAAVMIVLTQVILGNLLDVHMLITGLLVVVIVLVAPNGIIGFVDNLRFRKAPGLPAAVRAEAPGAEQGK